MVIFKVHIESIAIIETKYDAPCSLDINSTLAFTVALEGMQPG